MDERQSKRFMRLWLLSAVVTVVTFAIFAVAMDPYLLFGTPAIQNINARKPAVSARERMMKAFDVARHAPKTLLLGSSRVDIGLSARDPAWPAPSKPVYNMGLQAGNPYLAYRFLQHAMSQHKLSTVVMGLDFEYFLTIGDAPHAVGDDIERLGTIQAGASHKSGSWQRANDVLRATVSLDALVDSVVTLAANLGVSTSSVIGAGDLDWEIYRLVPVTGSNSYMEGTDVAMIRGLRNKVRNSYANEDIRAIVELCASTGTQLILVINPVHADMMEIFDVLGYWPEYENWKRELVALYASHRNPSDPTRLVLWDFSGYGRYATETVPADGRVLRWFWECSHYTPALGHLIVSRISGGGDPDFGTVLTPENLEAHLASIREQQRMYRQRNPADAQRVLDLHYLISLNPTRATQSARTTTSPPAH